MLLLIEVNNNNGALTMSKILIVDDDIEIRVLLSRVLLKLGHTVCDASNGVVAEQLTISWQPEVILMDYLMPLQDGCATSRKLRERGYQGHIVIISALASAGNDPASCGANSFMRKPVSMEQLDAYLSKLNIEAQPH
jgi:CheY-like chemotaxis protein